MNFIFQDWIRNKGNVKGRFVLVIFRIGQLLHKIKITRIIFLPLLIFIKILLDWFLNVDIPFKTKTGRGCVIYHGHSLVVFSDVIIGENCVLRHCTTIGNKGVGLESRSPTIGDNCDIGSNAVIIGGVSIGDNVIVGAGSVIIKSIPSNSLVVGNPGRIIKSNNE